MLKVECPQAIILIQRVGFQVRVGPPMIEYGMFFSVSGHLLSCHIFVVLEKTNVSNREVLIAYVTVIIITYKSASALMTPFLNKYDSFKRSSLSLVLNESYFISQNKITW